jgi:hypothetical protein
MADAEKVASQIETNKKIKQKQKKKTKVVQNRSFG